MQYILHDRNYNTGNIGRYMVQTWSQAKSSGKKLAEVQGVGKSVDPHSQPGKQTIQCIVSKVKDVSQTKPRLGQGRVGIRCKIKTQISKPTAQMVEKPLQIHNIPKIQDKAMAIPNFATPSYNQKVKVNDRKTMQDITREIPF